MLDFRYKINIGRYIYILYILFLCFDNVWFVCSNCKNRDGKLILKHLGSDPYSFWRWFVRIDPRKYQKNKNMHNYA